MNLIEKQISTEYKYKGKILSLRLDDALLPNGQTAKREVVEHNGGVCVAALDKDYNILMVKQFRYPYGEVIYEIPAGKLNAGEDPAETAIRELEEEGGIRAERVVKMFDVYPTPAYTNEIIRIYRAEGLSETQVKLDEDEFLSAVWVDKNEIKKMIERGEIKDAKTLIALLAVLK